MKNRRQFIFDICAAALALKFPTSVFANSAFTERSLPQTLRRIAFGSCDKAWKPQDIWANIADSDPDLFLFLGDTVYANKEEIKTSGVTQALDKAYVDLTKIKEFKQFREQIPILATWDDHDYGPRESGVEFAEKEATRKLFLDFWHVPENDIRRTQAGGIYAAYEYGPIAKRIQVILLDTRYGRTPLIELSGHEREQVMQSDFGPYLPNTDPSARMLHETQWAWLEEQLQCPADLRLICTSVPFAAGFRGWESWANFPLERDRLIRLIEKTKANGVVFLSGDMHYGDISCERENVPYPLWDVTSSGLTHFWPTPGPNSNRMYADTVHERNFGLLHLRWDLKEPLIVLEIRGEKGQLKLQHTLRINSLRH